MLAFTERHHDIDIGVVELSPSALVAGLRRGELDLIVLPGDDRPEFASRLLWHEPVRIALGSGHLLAAKQVLTGADLSRVLLLITQDDMHGAAHRLLVDHIGSSAALKTSMRPTGPERLETEIAAEEGAVLFCGDWTGKHADIVLRPIAPPNDRIAFRALWNNGDARRGVAELVAVLASQCEAPRG